jgi:tetratricopeptide (TPR) repeat protein
MNAKQDSKNDRHGESTELAISDGKNTRDSLVRVSPQPSLRRRAFRTILALGLLISTSTVAAVAVRGWPLFGRMGVQKPPAQPLANPSDSLNQCPVIPLESLFPDDSAGNLRNGAPQDDRNVARDRARLQAEDKPSTVSSAPLQSSAPIPDTAQAVITEAHRVADDLAERYPNDPDSLEIAARTLLWLGNSNKAAAAWERCLDLDSSYGYAYEGMGILAAKRGEYDEAVSLFRKALACTESASVGFGTHIRLATVLIDQGRLEEAIDLLSRPPETPHLPTDAIVLLGMAHLQSNRYAEARRYYEAAIADHPMHANAHFGLATACRRLGDTEAAARYLKRFQELRAGERDIRTDQRSQYDDVEEMREHLARMHSNAGRLSHAHRDLDEAIGHWRRAAALTPKAVECRQALAWFYQQDGRIREAITMLRQLSEIELANPAYLLEVGRLEASLGQYDEAEKTFQTVCDRTPESPDGYASLAKLHLKTGRNTERVAPLASTAVDLEPSVENLLLHAVACERNGEFAAAAAAIECVVRIDPNRPEYEQMHRELLKRLSNSNTP